MLDTDTAIEVLRGRNRPVIERLAASPREDIALCVVTVAELFFGAHRSRNSSRNLELCREFCESFEVLPLTSAAAERSAAVRARLETSGQRIGPHDVLIAGIALASNRVLVTHNSKEFGRVLDLKIEDWLAL
ncbi:MAG: type II toxin-antitoxin system VapC family toxin [Bryobacteraceae bacterium]